MSILHRDRIIASSNFNRWLIPPAALAVHLSIGVAYSFSVFWIPLSQSLGITSSISCTDMGILKALVTTSCDWRISDLVYIYTLFFVFLGISAALFGGWLERVGPRKAGVAAAFLWAGGLVIAAGGVFVHQLWLVWLGAGVIGGMGLGIGYISPVSTLIKWFPDRRGMATGMAIMGFGGGAIIGSPLAVALMNYFRSDSDVGVWQSFFTLAIIYFIFMMFGAFGYRLPRPEWVPAGWTPSVSKLNISSSVALQDAHKTQQFWLVWLVLCLNVSASIGIIGVASPMIQQLFGGRLLGLDNIPFTALDSSQLAAIAAIGAGFVGLISLFNTVGRFIWASLSDILGRGMTYAIFFILGTASYLFLPALSGVSLAGFVAIFCLVVSMYGGGFATIPAYLADLFGLKFVGAIHGRLLTAWSVAGIIGPLLVAYIREIMLDAGKTQAETYTVIFYCIAAMLALGFIANALIRPVPKDLFKAENDKISDNIAETGEIHVPNLLKSVLAWTPVTLALLWGLWLTITKAVILFS